MSNETTAPAYLIDADQLGPEFSGTLSDLGRFVEILAEECGTTTDAFELRQHIGQPAGAQEPEESAWSNALDRFSEERPDLF